MYLGRTPIKGVTFSEEEQEKYGIGSIPNIYEFTNNKLGWLDVENICKLTFEELVLNEESRNKAIVMLVDYLFNDIEYKDVDKSMLLETIKINIDPKSSGTFRKGSIGDWKEEFNEEHKNAFKEIAGELLIKLGYETDYNW